MKPDHPKLGQTGKRMNLNLCFEILKHQQAQACHTKIKTTYSNTCFTCLFTITLSAPISRYISMPCSYFGFYYLELTK